MKKYILMLAVAAAATLVACGNKEANVEEAEVVDTVAVEEVVDTVVVADSTAVDTVVAEIVEAVAE